MKTENKRVLRYTLFGSIFMMIVVLGTGLLGVSPRIQGFKAAINDYWNMWMPAKVATPLTYFCVTLLLFDIALLIAVFIMALVKKKGLLILPAFGLFLSLAFLPFLFLLTIPQVEAGKLGRLAFYLLCSFTLGNLIAILVFAIPLAPLFSAGLGLFKALGGKEEKKQEAKEEAEEEEEAPAEDAQELATKEEVKALEEKMNGLVEAAIAAHKEELHNGEAPKEEEADEDEDEGEEDEEEEYEEVEEVNEAGEVVKVKRKKRVKFETKLKNSVFDLRHKYYDLRDYIKWYGINNRISIPGDTFSYKRKKFAFITIVGKRLKLYLALDPAKYEDSPIPVERASAKKYMDVPCLLKIKSDLSYRRAKALVDAMMEEAGIAKPEGEEPKETQNPGKE